MKTALVTGSSRGIGRGIADLLCENGYTVVYCGTKPQRPADLAPEADYFPCDISDGAQRHAVIAHVLDETKPTFTIHAEDPVEVQNLTVSELSL